MAQVDQTQSNLLLLQENLAQAATSDPVKGAQRVPPCCGATFAPECSELAASHRHRMLQSKSTSGPNPPIYSQFERAQDNPASCKFVSPAGPPCMRHHHTAAASQSLGCETAGHLDSFWCTSTMASTGSERNPLGQYSGMAFCRHALEFWDHCKVGHQCPLAD